MGVVLGRRADHRGTTDIDILDATVIVRACRNGRLERVEIDHEQIDQINPVGLHGQTMGGIVAQRQQPAMAARV